MPKKKLKNYEVRMTAFATILVLEAENGEHAIDLAADKIRIGDMELDEAWVEKEVNTEEELESLKRHAQAIAKNI